MKIAKYEITTAHDHPQYYAGDGIAFSDWTAIAQGAGTTEREAIDEALEALETDGWDITPIQIEEADREYAGPCADDCDWIWFASIKVIEAPSEKPVVVYGKTYASTSDVVAEMARILKGI